MTILLMPYEMVEMPIELSGQSIEGVILPVGDGSIAIIGERGEAIDRSWNKSHRNGEVEYLGRGCQVSFLFPFGGVTD